MPGQAPRNAAQLAACDGRTLNGMGRALDSTGTFEAQGRSAPRLHVSGLVAKETCAFHEQIVRRTENGKAMLKLLQADHRLTPHAHLQKHWCLALVSRLRTQPRARKAPCSLKLPHLPLGLSHSLLSFKAWRCCGVSIHRPARCLACKRPLSSRPSASVSLAGAGTPPPQRPAVHCSLDADFAGPLSQGCAPSSR